MAHRKYSGQSKNPCGADGDEPFQLECNFKHATSKAMLVETAEGDLWIPFSILDESQVEELIMVKGNRLKFDVPLYFAYREWLV